MGTGTVPCCSPVSALLHHRSQHSVVTIWPGAHTMLPGALQALQLSMLSTRPRCICPRAPGFGDVPRVHVATLPRAGSGHRLGPALRCWLRAGGSLLPPHFLAQPLAASLRLPGATCKRRALSGCRRSIYNPGWAALPFAPRRCVPLRCLPACVGARVAAELRCWSFGFLGAFGVLQLLHYAAGPCEASSPPGVPRQEAAPCTA